MATRPCERRPSRRNTAAPYRKERHEVRDECEGKDRRYRGAHNDHRSDREHEARERRAQDSVAETHVIVEESQLQIRESQEDRREYQREHRRYYVAKLAREAGQLEDDCECTHEERRIDRCTTWATHCLPDHADRHQEIKNLVQQQEKGRGGHVRCY